QQGRAMFSKKSKGATTFKDKSGISAFLWMLLGAIIVIITGLIAYKSEKFTFLQNKKNNDDIEIIDAKTIKLKKDTQEDNYEFYDILPEQKTSTISDDALISEIAQSDPTPKVNLDEFKPDVIVTTDKEESPKKVEAKNSAIETSKTTTDLIDVKNIDNKEILTTEKIIKEEQKKPTTKNKIVKGDDEIVIVYDEKTYEENNKTEKEITTKIEPNKQKEGFIKIERVNIQPIKEAIPTNKKSYVLQINTYNEASQADKRRAQVLMAGVDAKVIKKVNGGTIVYQVVSTPMTKPSDVLKSQRLLQKNGIDSLIIEQRHK
ncbi:MAG: SPOR domain-containing protein, partial [Moraxellaceae bacterium]|nr:SPOR domain-containing protein [Moraxellaceae bacterium]